MLKERILATLKFFDLFNYPLTLLEMRSFLLADPRAMLPMLDDRYELMEGVYAPVKPISIFEVLSCLEKECGGLLETRYGFYALAGRGEIITRRWQNYSHGFRRERLIKRYIGWIKNIPFVRGVGLAGSQAMGLAKQDSDIDLLLLARPGRLWLARLLVTIYFQLTGRRRYGSKVADRFCLNHYLAAGHTVAFDRNLYTAAEYLKLRPLVFSAALAEFQNSCAGWIKVFFPNASFPRPAGDSSVPAQAILEKLLSGRFGAMLERAAKKIQHRRIGIGEFIAASDEELSFHPNNRKQELFRRFFESQQKQGGKTM